MCGHVLTVDCGHGSLDVIVVNSNLGGGLDLYASAWEQATGNAPPGETKCSVQLSGSNPIQGEGPRCYYAPDSEMDNAWFRMVGVFNVGARMVTGATLNGVAGAFNGVQPYFAFQGGPIGGDGQVVFSFNDGSTFATLLRDCVREQAKQMWS
ncbi:hypothetical protein BV898_19114 [Hypsibius exemplaris]|uniref:Uncharacterized protein n=1 Tax=Hypsibius exemplaris TaxID=2072580 RepID=A0A9X6NL22_HYPEX|nr:hypothetical protein BV898_19114 [Hypsibius exemplaris]